MLAGCATAPSSQELLEADYGSYPENYEEIIKNYMSNVLKDPMTAEFRFDKVPQKLWIGGLFTKRQFGYGTCASINAKNAFGGYVGFRRYFFLINDSTVVEYRDTSEMSKNPCDF